MARFRRVTRDYERLPETLAGLHLHTSLVLHLLTIVYRTDSGPAKSRRSILYDNDSMYLVLQVQLSGVRKAANELRFSSGASLHWESIWTQSSFQKRDDLVGAERRPR